MIMNHDHDHDVMAMIRRIAPNISSPRKLHSLLSLTLFSSTLIALSPIGITHVTLAFAFAPTLLPSSFLANRWCRRRPKRLSYPRIMSSSSHPSNDNDENNSKHIMESPSAERNKGPIYDLVLSPIIFPRLLIDQQQQQQQINRSNDSYDEPKIRVLELAAGCGVHTTHFVSSFLSTFVSSSREKQLHIEWHPSDPDLDARRSIDARVAQSNLKKYVLPSNSWILGTRGGTACNDGGHRDGDDGNAGAANHNQRGNDVEEYASHHREYFDLILCINMIHIAPWEATLGLMECGGKVLRKGGWLMCYGPFKVDGTAVASNLAFDASLRSKDPRWGIRNLEDVVEAAEKEGGLEYVQRVDMPANNLSVIFRKKDGWRLGR